MAWTEKRPAGWFVRWRDADGRKGRLGPYPAKGDADRAVSEYAARVPPKRRAGAATGPRPIAPLTIGQIATLWREARMDDTERMRRPGAQTYLDDTIRRVVAVAEGWTVAGQAARPVDITIERAAALRRKAKRTSASLRAILRWARGHHGIVIDPRVDEALKPPPSRKAAGERMTDREALAVLGRARRLGQLPLISCLATYGWRPITACRLNVGDVDLKGARISLLIKHDGEPWWHPLFPFHVDMLRPLVEGREASEALFVPNRSPANAAGEKNQRDRPRWTISTGGSAGMLAVWFRRNLLRGVGTKQLRKLAISRMRAGEWPWARPMDPVDVRRFTGQKSDAMVPRYEQTNLARARAFMAENTRGQIGGRGAR